MNPIAGLAQYLEQLERRLRLFAWTRGAAATAGVALLLTVAIVGALTGSAFTPSTLLFSRALLFLGIGAVVALALIVPLMRMNRRRAASEVERKRPGFDQRLLTFHEKQRDNADDPFLPLLAEDALTMTRDAQPEMIVEQGRLLGFAAVAATAFGVLAWLMFWGPGVFGYGTQVLWGSLPKTTAMAGVYSVKVDPGSKTVRRRSDMPVTAHLSGYTATKASLWAKYASSGKWEEVPMQVENGGSGFGFTFVGLPEDVEYYVEAGGIKSSAYKLHTVDLPGVKNIAVTYNYPSWSGIPSNTENPGGDLRAVEGTTAHLDIETDRPLSDGQIVFEEGKPLQLDATKVNASKANKTGASVTIAKDGMYHVGVAYQGEIVRISDDYFIEARKVTPPTLRISKPGRDAKVSPIEEVGVQVTAEDEYPLQELSLRYSVNGGAEKTISLLKDKGTKKSEGTSMLSMEDFKAVPGDIVSLYAVARDGKNTQKTDMMFVQAVPFEFNYTQSQQAGGGGGGGGGGQQQDTQISEREKEIIAATFNQLKGDAKAKATAADTAKYLAETQAKLREQAKSLSDRTKARQLDDSGAAFTQFVKEMDAAIASMAPASEKLKAQGFQEALAPEQQTLQHLLRAESTFRDIQIQISRGGGGGGGGGGGAGRDLANLFDLELDKEQNQYETNARASGGSQQQQAQQKVDDAMKKLEELAKRQQDLAQQQRQATPQQLAAQKFQQEMLRRETAKLEEQVNEMLNGQQQQGQQQQGQQQGQQSGQQQGGQQQGGQQSGQQQSGQQRGGQQQGGQQQAGQQQSGQQQSGQQQGQQSLSRNNGLSQSQTSQLEQTMRQIQQAERAMSDAASSRQQNTAQTAADAQRAADAMKQANQNLQNMQKQETGNQMGDLANKAERLSTEQRDFEQQMRKNFGSGDADPKTADQMAKQEAAMREQFSQIQKDLQQATRSTMGTQPDVAKQLRDAAGHAQQAEIDQRMQLTEQRIQQGAGYAAVGGQSLITQGLEQLKDDLRTAQQTASSGRQGGDGTQRAQNGINQLQNMRAQLQALGGAQQARANGGTGRTGNGQGQQGQGQQGQGQQGQGQQGQGQGQQQASNGQGQGQGQQGQGQGQGQQGQGQGQQGQGQGQQGQGQGQQGQGQGQQGQGQGQQGQGQQGQGQQGQGQQGQGRGQGQGQGQGQQAGGQRGGGGNPQGGGNVNGPRQGGGQLNGGNYGVNYGGNDFTPGGFGTAPTNAPEIRTTAEAQALYNQMVRQMGELRPAIAGDPQLAKEYQDLATKIQGMDPAKWGAHDAELAARIASQALTELDQLELMLRKKAGAADGSVRSASPASVTPGYGNAFAEYTKKLSNK